MLFLRYSHFLSLAALIFFACGTNGNSATAQNSEDGSNSSSLLVKPTSSSVVTSSSSSIFCTNSYGVNTVTDCRDNHTYKTVVIGNQTWMAENLAYLPSVNTEADNSGTEAKYYVYDYNGTVLAEAKASRNYTTYGVLYNWTAAMAGAASSTASPSGVKGVCLADWHLPSDAEWSTLVTYAGGSSKAGTKLKTTSGWSKDYGYIAGSDIYGFSALPGGSFYYSSFEEVLIEGRWWTATEFGPTYANNRYMSYEYAEVGMSGSDMNNGFSVRCIQD